MLLRRIAVLIGALAVGGCAGRPPGRLPAPEAAAAPVQPPAASTDSAAAASAAADAAAARTVGEPAAAPLPRTPSVRAPLRAAVRIVFTGDINLGTATLAGGVPPDDGRAFLAGARPYLAGDLVIGNFEGVLADSGTSLKCGPPATPRRGQRPARRSAPPRVNCYAFRTPTRLAPRLVEAGFTHLNLANNHSNDFGPGARAGTERTLHALGLATYGPLGQIAIDTVRRGDSVTTVGVIGFSTYPFAYNLLDLERSRTVIDSIRPLVDRLVVTFHGGAEGAAALRTGAGPEFLGAEPRGNLRQWARIAIDAGADVVVGHGPHVLRGIEYYRGRPIVYSLGNFATYRGFNVTGPSGVTGVLQLDFGSDGTLAGARVVPMRQEPRAGPAPDAGGAAVRLLRRLSEQDFGANAARITDDGVISAP